MKCIIVDDEPLARETMEMLISEVGELELIGNFNNAEDASDFINKVPTDLIFLDINMPDITGLEFAKSISKTTLVIFTTAYSEYALDSYEVDAIDFLVKPIETNRFRKAVEKAISYHALLIAEENAEKSDDIGSSDNEYIFVKSDRRYSKVNFKDILFIEGLMNYVVIQLEDQRIITKLTLKVISDMLPKGMFMRVNRSYIVNLERIDSFDNNDIFIKTYEIAIGNSYRDEFFQTFVSKRI